jgi:hypothetical protein
MKIPKHFEELKIIFEFLDCKVYETYRSPTAIEYIVEGVAVVNLSNKGLETGGFQNKMLLSRAQFHQSWVWFFFVWNKLREKIRNDEATMYPGETETLWIQTLINDLIDGNLEGAFMELVEGIRWYNNKNSKI